MTQKACAGINRAIAQADQSPSLDHFRRRQRAKKVGRLKKYRRCGHDLIHFSYRFARGWDVGSVRFLRS